MGQGASDIRAGRSFYEMMGLDKLSPVLEKIKKNAATFGTFMKRIGTASAVAGAGLAAPITALFKGGLDRAANLAQLNRQLGVPIEVLNKLQYAADAAGVSLDEVMQDTQGRFSDLIAKAPAIDPKDARAAAQTQLELADATRSLQLALLPLVQTVVLYVKQASAWVQQNSGAARTVAVVAGGLLALGLTIKLTSFLFGGLATAAGTAYSVVGTPFLLGAAAGAAFVAIVLWATGELKGFAEFLGNGFGGAARTAAAAWGGISDALAKGDLAAAGKIALKGLEIVWLDFTLTLTTAWVGFKMIFVDTWAEMVAEAQKLFVDFTAFVERNVGGVLKPLLKAAGEVAAQVDSIRGQKLLDLAATLNPSGAAGRASLAKEEIDKNLADDLAKRKEAREDDLRDAILAVKKAKDELAALNAEAAAPGGGGGLGLLGESMRPLKQGLIGGVSVKGSFSGAALGQQLGIGNETQKQTELLTAIKDGNGNLAKAIGEATGKSIAELLSID